MVHNFSNILIFLHDTQLESHSPHDSKYWFSLHFLSSSLNYHMIFLHHEYI